MKRRFFSLLTGFLFALSSFLLIATPVHAQNTRPWGEECYTGITYDGVEIEAATLQGFECLVANILATATTFIGFAAFVMVIFGAFLYLTSGGNSTGIETAKKSITYGIIGIIVALLAFFILVVIAQFTGVSIIKQFNITIN